MAQGRKIDTDSNIDNILALEQGAAPANPDTGKWRLYFKADGLYYLEDDGTEVGPLVVGGGGYTEGARVYNSGVISINDITNTILTFDSERFDTDGIHSIIANTGRLTCQTAGKYAIWALLAFDTDAVGLRQANILLNGATGIARVRQPDSSTGNDYLLPTCEYVLSVTDYVEVQVYQASGGALNIIQTANITPEFMMQRIG